MIIKGMSYVGWLANVTHSLNIFQGKVICLNRDLLDEGIIGMDEGKVWKSS
jgi:hypothetical protein